MKKSILILLFTAFAFIANAQEWRFEIEPMPFGCKTSELYNDTADRLLVKVITNVGDSMELFCELSNSKTRRPVREGRSYFVPIQILSLLIANGKNIEQINQVLAAFDVVAIKEL